MRHVLRSRPWLAAFVLAAALVVRVLVPVGFMPVAEKGRITAAICTGYGPMQAAIAIPGFEHRQTDGEKARSSCAFADLAGYALTGADPIPLAALVAFVLALAHALSVPIPPRAWARLRPPLRGPPRFA